MTREILIVGGAGYIGSHMVALLKAENYNPIVLDDLSNGHVDAVQGAQFIQGDCGDGALLDSLFKKYEFQSVIHFASYIQVGESVVNPAIYYENNITKTLVLLKKMIEHKVDNFIFSSTAAVYGNPQTTPICESHPCKPINPYGKSKYFIEQILEDYKSAYGLNYGCLRYFNAAGAHPTIDIGERHDPETHLIPLILQAASGRRKNIKIFGGDYDTPDGTCIRDYIHVCDLANAHLKLLEYMIKGGNETIFNLGTGTGYSILEIINNAKIITGKKIKTEHHDRREGDPAILVADGTKAQKLLNWQATSSNISTILKDAWKWEQTYNI